MIRFLPFEGINYRCKSIFSKRILVLGESHYSSDPNPLITRNVMQRYLDRSYEREDWMKTFLKFERSLVGHKTTPEESVQIWNSVLFYNYLQFLVSGPREAGTKKQYEESENAFFEVLEKYSPEVVIVWGQQLWEQLPETGWEGAKDVMVEGYAVKNGFYDLPNGNRVRIFMIYHPSSGYSWDYWYKVISQFI